MTSHPHGQVRAAVPAQSRTADGHWLEPTVPVPTVDQWWPAPAVSDAGYGLAEYPSSHGSVPAGRDIETTVPLVPGQRTADHHGADANRPSTEVKPSKAQVMLREQLFLSLLSRRVATAALGLAMHCKENVGQTAREPGPNALVLLSGQPRRHGTTPDVVASSRLFLAGEADDLFAMLTGMTTLVQKTTAAARRDGRLLAGLDARSQRRTARQVIQGWEHHDRFPYEQALAQGSLWDPRMPELGITSDSEPLTADTVYLGLAVITLDTDNGTWSSMKHQWTRATDPATGLPLGPAHIRASGFAVFDDQSAVQIQRWPALGAAQTTHEITCTRTVGASLDSRGRNRVDPQLTATSPPPFAHRDLWAHLYSLHAELRAAFTPKASA